MHIDKPIVIALTLFVILLLIFFLVSPEYQKFKTLQAELGIKKAEYNAEFDYYSAIAQSYNKLIAYSKDIKKIDSALPSSPSLGKLIYNLQDQTEKSGLILKSLFLTKGLNSTTKEGVKEIAFSLNLIGNYSALENFISALEKSSKLFEITNISFGAGDMSSSEAQFQTQSIYSFSMQISTHTY